MQLLDCHWLISTLGDPRLARWMTTDWNALLGNRHQLRRLSWFDSLLTLFVLALVTCFSNCTIFAADTVVICPGSLRSALQPWCEYREKQGYKLQFVLPAATAGLTRGTILTLPKRWSN